MTSLSGSFDAFEVSITGLIVTTDAATTGDTQGNYIRFTQTDQALNSSYLYGGLTFEGRDIGNNGVRGFVKGVSEGTSGQFGLSFGTQDSGPSNPLERLRINKDEASNAPVFPELTAASTLFSFKWSMIFIIDEFLFDLNAVEGESFISIICDVGNVSILL